MTYTSGKTYTHSSGFSCCFRQFRAKESNCKYLHGYALQVELQFERAGGGLDARNWVMGFGDLKPMKEWLATTFDHKTIVAYDDPDLNMFYELHNKGIIQLMTVANVGMEAFSKMIFDKLTYWLRTEDPDVLIKKVTVREHEGNWACYYE